MKYLSRIMYISLTITFIILFTLSCTNTSASTLFNDSTSPLQQSNQVADAVKTQKAFNEIFELYQDRVVYISTEQTIQSSNNPYYNDPFFREFFRDSIPRNNRRRTRTGLGSGFILTADGYIATNHHVIANVDKVTVKINETEYNAEIIGSDERTDIALLKINPDKQLEPVFIGNSDEVKVGDWAIAIGNPFGLDKTFTTGVVSAAAREDIDFMGGSNTHIQTDASINPGNSGGPLINIYGEVIGINRMIYSNSGGNMGIGFAIPINRARIILEELRNHGKIKRGYIGVQIVPLSEDYAGEIGLNNSEGALVGAVLDDGPAQKGGVKVGDVILEVNGNKVTDYRSLVEAIEKIEIGKGTSIVVWRDKRKLTLFVTIKERP
jgi:serine protease Do